jgi:hypothetical protein
MAHVFGGISVQSQIFGDAAPLKKGVRASTTTSGTLSTDFESGDTIDGITLVTDDRILIKDQADPIENGIYLVKSTGAPERSEDFPAGASAVSVIIIVYEGTENGDTMWMCTNDETSAIVGTASLSFTYVGGKLATASDASSSTDSAIVRYSGADGKKLKNSSVIVSDTADISGVSYLQFADTAAPANPADAEGRLYKKSGNQGIFWKPNSAGVEVDIADAAYSGASAKIYVPSFTVTEFTTTNSEYISVTNGDITLPAGTWLVTYNVHVTLQVFDMSLALFLDDTIQSATEMLISNVNNHGLISAFILRHALTVNGSEVISLKTKRTSGATSISVTITYIDGISLIAA